MGVLSNKVDKSMLKKGDHIYSYRKAHLYSNHGIYVGEDRVIHYMSSSKSEGGCTNCRYDSNKQRGVVKTCLDCFLKGHSLYRFEYQVSSAHYVAKRSATCYTGSCNKPNVVVRRATRMLNNNGGNNLNFFEKNSVCFAVLCKTGNPNSAQEVAAKSKVKMALGLLDDLWTFAALFGLIDPQTDDDQATGNPNSAQEAAAKSKVKMVLKILDDLWTLAALFGLIDPQTDDDQATGNPNSAQEVAAKSKVKMALGLLDDLRTLAALFGLIDPQTDDDQAAESDDVDESGDVGGEDDEDDEDDGDEDEDAGEDDVDEDDEDGDEDDEDDGDEDDEDGDEDEDAGEDDVDEDAG